MILNIMDRVNQDCFLGALTYGIGYVKAAEAHTNTEMRGVGSASGPFRYCNQCVWKIISSKKKRSQSAYPCVQNYQPVVWRAKVKIAGAKDERQGTRKRGDPTRVEISPELQTLIVPNAIWSVLANRGRVAI